MISNIFKKTINANYIKYVLPINKVSTTTNILFRNPLSQYCNNKIQSYTTSTSNNSINNSIRFYTTTTTSNVEQSNEQVDEKVKEQVVEESTIEIDFKERILENSLKYVNLYGWTSEAISQSCIELGYQPTTQGIFGNDSTYELALYFVSKCNKTLLDQITSEQGEQLLHGKSKKDKLKIILKGRLSLIKPYIGRWSEVMTLLANPKNIVNSSPSMLNLVDTMWFLVGDKSSDFDWYAKRGLLAALYTSSELFMMSDTSMYHSNTWRFVDDRVEDLIKTIKFKNDIEQTVGVTLNTLLSTFQKK